MLCLNFDFYIIPLTLLLTFLKQYVMCMLLADRNVNPEEQVCHYLNFVTIFIPCKLMFNLQEVLWATLHSLSIHGCIFVRIFCIFVAFLLDTLNRFY